MLGVLSLIVAVGGLIGVLFNLRQSNRARLRQFEGKYVERYWSLLDKLSLGALSVADQEAGPEDEDTIRRYILLCEDELQMRKNGYISDATYLEWADGMLDQFRQPMFREVWVRILNEHNPRERGVFPYANLRKLLEPPGVETSDADKTADTASKLNIIKRADPIPMRTPARVIRGLKGITGILVYQDLNVHRASAPARNPP